MLHYLMMADRSLYPTVSLSAPVENLSWVSGSRLADTIPKLAFEVEAGTDFTWPDFIRPAANIPLFSPAMRAALDAARADNIEYHEAEVLNKSTMEKRPYHAANVLGLVDAMDRGRSAFTPFRGSATVVRSIERLALDPERCGAFKLFRLAEFDLLIVVDENVKGEIEKLQGVVLMPPEDWDGFRT